MAGMIPVCPESAVEDDEDEGYRADVSGNDEIIEMYFQQPVGTDQHSKQNEQRQGRDAHPAGELAQKQTYENNRRGGQNISGHIGLV